MDVSSSSGQVRAVGFSPTPARRWPLFVISALAIAVFVLDLRWQPGGRHATRAVDDLTQLLAASGTAAAGFWRAARERDRMRLSWLFIASGAACWAAGQAMWSYCELVRVVDAPFPSPADAGYLLLPVLAMVGLLLRPSRAFADGGRLRIGLDILLVLASLFTVSWATTLGQVYRTGEGSPFARLVSLAYPAGDLALLTVVITVLAFAHNRGRFGLVCIGGGLAALSVADSGFAYLSATGGYHTGNLIDACWVSGFVILGIAAVLDRHEVEHQRERQLSHVRLVLPYLPSIFGLAFTVWRLGPSNGDKSLLAAVAIMITVLLVRQVVSVVENARLADRMRYQAFHDPLTGLPNRALFTERLERALARHALDRRGLTVLLVDLDDFKSVNDNLGHAAGDELLIVVGSRLRACVRGSDTVARLGGDEFAVLLEDASHGPELRTRISARLAEPALLGTTAVASGGSVGVAALSPSDPTPSLTEMLNRADVSMYAAKRATKAAMAVAL